MKTVVVGLVTMAGLVIAGSVMAVEGPAPEKMNPLMKKYNCNVCHGIEIRMVGPRLVDIASKYKGAAKFEYKGKEYPLAEGLVMKVSQGGAGHWGPMPMPAIDPKGSRQDDMKELVNYILGLAK